MIIAKTNDSREVGLLAELLQKFTNGDEWAVVRIAELRAAGELATSRVVWIPHPLGTAFAVQVRRQDGTIEIDPFESPALREAMPTQKG